MIERRLLTWLSILTILLALIPSRTGADATLAAPPLPAPAAPPPEWPSSPWSAPSLVSSPTVAGEEQSYTIAPGDGLYAVSRQHGLSHSAVARANRIVDPNIVPVGKVLVLPTRYILPAVRDEGLVVNIPEYRLYLFRGGTLRAVYPIAVGLPTWQTPVGSFTVTSKVKNPAWYMPPELAERENVKREVVPPGPENPLGDFWIGLSLKHVGIHSTNSPMTVGRALSHGCMRLYPEHLNVLSAEVAVGESGEILYLPVKVAVEGNDVLVEVHPDVYGLVPDLGKTARESLKALGVWERVDVALLRRAIFEARGVPVPVNLPVGGK